MAQSESIQLVDEVFNASKLLLQGRRVEALAIYHDVESRAGTSALLQYQLGHLCDEFGDIDLAVSHYQRAVDAEAENIQYLCALGLAQINAGETEVALATFRRADSIDPENLSVLQGLGSYYLGIADNDRALEYLEAALLRKPGNPVIRTNLAIALTNLNRHEEALVHARKAVKVDESNPDAVQALCNTLTEMGRMDEAQLLLQKNIRKHADFGPAYDLLARIRTFSTQDDKFIRRAEKALEKGMPASSRQHLSFALGKMHDDCKRYDEAFACYRHANLLARKDFDTPAISKRLKSMRAVFTADTVSQYQSLGSDSAQPVFIVGMPRAGTTLMAQMIASHPRASSAGEMEDMQAISDRIFAPAAGAPSAAQLRNHLTSDSARDFASSYLRSLARGQPRAERIVDKAPMNFQHIGLIATLFPKAIIINALRHPLDTCLSCYFQNFSTLGWSNDLENLAEIYILYRETMDYWRNTLPDIGILDLSYEQLVEDPETQSRRMIEACGLDWDDAVLEYTTQQAIIKTASLAQARQPVYRSSRYRWQNYAAQIGELASHLSAYLDEADRELLAARGIKLDRRPRGGWLQRMFR